MKTKTQKIIKTSENVANARIHQTNRNQHEDTKLKWENVEIEPQKQVMHKIQHLSKCKKNTPLRVKNALLERIKNFWSAKY